MSHFCVSTIFVVIFMLIDFGMASWPEKSAKFYKECVVLSKSKEFTKMVGIMRGQIPLEAAKLMMPTPTDGPNANSSPMNMTERLNLDHYYNLIGTLDVFLERAKHHRAVHRKDVRKNGAFAGEYYKKTGAAFNFVENNEELLKKLAKDCGNSTWRTTSAEEVLKKTVKCADAVHLKYVKEDCANNQQMGGHAKGNEWKDLDANFQTAIVAITQKEGTNANNGQNFVG